MFSTCTLAFFLCLLSLVAARTATNRPTSSRLSTAEAFYHTGNEHDDNWNYDASSDQGPQHWGKNFPHCYPVVSDPYPFIPHTTRQSPINIVTSQVQQSTSIPLSWRYYYPSLQGTIKESHKAPTFEVRGYSYYMSVQNANFRLQQFHFHFTDHEMNGTEHAVDSQKFDAEVHFVHYNIKYGSFENAVDKQDGLLVVAVFLKVGCPADPIMDQMLRVFYPMRNGYRDYQATIPSANVLRNEFYIYEGSTTSPSCHEHVLWLVQRQPIGIFQYNMDMLRALRYKEHNDGERIAKIGNTRPLQSYYTPNVYSNFNPYRPGYYQEISDDNCY